MLIKTFSENCIYLRLFVLELHQKPKPILRKNYRFSLTYGLFFPSLPFRKLLRTSNFDLSNVPIRFTFPLNKIPLKKIEAVLLDKNNDDRQKKKHIIVKSLQLSLRSESKRKMWNF